MLGEVQKVSLETGDRLEHFEGQLKSFLSTMKSLLPTEYTDLTILDSRSLQIDTNQVLGRGASGIVYAGLLYGSTEVAVKILSSPTTTASNSNAFDQLRRELERTIRVGSHRNIIKIYGMVARCTEFKTGHCPPAVVMERIGKTLESISHKSPQPQLMKLTNDIISGMARVHDLDEGVVHFDLKPQNILLTRDFGIAQTKTTVAFASASDSAMVRGTVSFMAPEIFLGTSRGFPCDVYSFSMVLFVLWSGRQPWNGFDERAIASAVQQGSRL